MSGIVNEERFQAYYARNTAVEPAVWRVRKDKEERCYIVLRAFSHADYNKDEQVRFKMSPIEATEIGWKLTAIADYLKAVVQKAAKGELKDFRHTETLAYHKVETPDGDKIETKFMLQMWSKSNKVGAALVFSRSVNGDDAVAVNVPMTLGQLYHLGRLLDNLGTSPEITRVRFLGNQMENRLAEREVEEDVIDEEMENEVEIEDEVENEVDELVDEVEEPEVEEPDVEEEEVEEKRVSAENKGVKQGGVPHKQLKTKKRKAMKV